MNAVDLGVNLFVTLFALLDPIGNLPIFAATTAGATLRQRISVSALICTFAAVFLAFFLFTGLGLLQFFGISLAAFRIAGGILLLLLGLDMARGDFLALFADKDAIADSQDVRGYARRRFQRLVGLSAGLHAGQPAADGRDHFQRRDRNRLLGKLGQ